MCGRFTLRVSAELLAGEFLVILLEPLPPRYNIAPSQAILVIIGSSERMSEASLGTAHQARASRSEPADQTEPLCRDQTAPTSGAPSDRQLMWMHWGFRRLGSGGKTTQLMVNLRAETALGHPRFRRLLETHRSVVIADGFYEWEKIAGNAHPFFIHRKDARPFGMAALWKPANSADPCALPECVVLTTPANRLIRPIHDRMPAILLPEHYSMWLDSTCQCPEELEVLLKPYPDELLEAYPVSQRVNSPDYDQPDCILPQVRPHQARLFELEKP